MMPDTVKTEETAAANRFAEHALTVSAVAVEAALRARQARAEEEARQHGLREIKKLRDVLEHGVLETFGDTPDARAFLAQIEYEFREEDRHVFSTGASAQVWTPFSVRITCDLAPHTRIWLVSFPDGVVQLVYSSRLTPDGSIKLWQAIFNDIAEWQALNDNDGDVTKGDYVGDWRDE